jgi:archaellum component FlaC
MRSFRSAQRHQTINEFQNQQKRIAELESTVGRLAETVKEQAAQIEKVSAQLELQKPAQRVVASEP